MKILTTGNVKYAKGDRERKSRQIPKIRQFIVL